MGIYQVTFECMNDQCEYFKSVFEVLAKNQANAVFAARRKAIREGYCLSFDNKHPEIIKIM